ncbi:MAG: helix-turn-helix transcriptional regulator [Clostridiales bacterium]|nr:helix-turn-helix transcriptional regulator [Clostridiales bacterium]
MKLVHEVKRRRLECGMTQGDLAKAAGVSRATILAIERYQTNPTLHTLERIAEALGCEARDLQPKKETPHPGTGQRVNVTVLIDGKPVIFPENGR